jgi:hypothetical protein
MRARGPATIAIAAGAFALSAAAANAAPANDDFADAKPIRVGQTVRGTTAGATGEPGEPAHGPGTTQSVWYRLRSLGKVSVLLNTCRAEGDSVIAVYTGRRVGALRLIDFNDDGCAGLGSRVSFTARPGRTYFIAIAPYDDDEQGTFRLGARAIDTPSNDDFVDARTLARVIGDRHHAERDAGARRAVPSRPLGVVQAARPVRDEGAAARMPRRRAGDRGLRGATRQPAA